EDLDRLVLEVVLLDEVFAGEDGSAGAVRRGAALELSERLVDHRRGEDVLDRVLVLELRVGVVNGMLVVLIADLGEMERRRAVLLHVLAARVAEELRGRWMRLEPTELHHRVHVLVHRVGAVGESGAERALLHLLEAEGEDAVSEATLDELLAHEEGGGAGGTVVVDVVDGNAGETELLDRALPAGGLAVDVAYNSLLDLRVRNTGVVKGFRAGFLRHVGVVPGL